MARAVGADPRIDTEFASYRIEQLLGRGGMSVVYLAEDLNLDRKVALKLLAPQLAADERFQRRFLRESKLAASIDHANIIPIYDAGGVDDRLYIAMRYVHGTDLSRVIADEGRLDPVRAITILGQVAGALDAAHEAGLVHRDVKPSNILIATEIGGSEHIYLSDFGLTQEQGERSSAVDRTELVLQASGSLGTIDYAAPEQIEGGSVGARSDVYSLGCVLYECLTGVVPFRSSSAMGVLFAHLEERVPAITERRPDLPAGIDGVIATALAKEAEDRYTTCRELIEAAGTELQISEEVVFPVAPPAKSRWRWVALAAIAVLVAAVAAVGVLLTTLGDDGAAPTATPLPAAEAEATAEPADEVAAADLSDVPIITTIAGTGEATFSGNGGLATEARLAEPGGLALDGDGNLYIADGNRIRQIDASGTIRTIAGDGPRGTLGDGGPAIEATFSMWWVDSVSLAGDAEGNLYVADTGHNRIRKIDRSGIVTTIAGTGAIGSAGDGGPAVEADLKRPSGIAVDDAGNVYLAEFDGNRVRKIDSDGRITTIAGTGQAGFSGDGGPAIEAELNFPRGVAIDGQGNVYVSDSNHRVRRITPAGTITTYAGNGTAGNSGDGGRAFNAQLLSPDALVFDSGGNLYIADAGNSVIRRVDPSGFIGTVAGSGRVGDAGDGEPAAAAELDLGGEGPSGLAVDSVGNLYISDKGNNRIRKVTFPATEETEPRPAVAAVADGSTITTVAGTGATEFSGDGGPASAAGLDGAGGLAFDADGNLYIGDGNRIRRIDSSGSITTSAGTGNHGFSGDGGPATAAEFWGKEAGLPIAGCRGRIQCLAGLPLAADENGNVYVADMFNLRIRKVDVAGDVTTIAGTGRQASSGDGGPALEAEIEFPIGIAVEDGNIYFAEHTGTGRIRKIDRNGIITTVAGSDSLGYSGDGGPATEAGLNLPFGIAVSDDGEIYFSDLGNHVVRKIDTDGVIRTIAGTGTAGYSGDRGRAIEAQLWRPEGVALDAAGNLYIADAGNSRIRRVDTNGFITTVAGTGGQGFSGDGGPPSVAEIDLGSLSTVGLVLDGDGNLYIADSGNARIRKVTFAEEP